MMNNLQSHMNSPCAACKFLRRKCTSECVFAPYFPPDQPQKFAFVHRLYGASNVAKIISDVSPDQREDAVNSLAYEAEARLRDPVYGCVGFISLLQRSLRQLQNDLLITQKELSAWQRAMAPMIQPPHMITSSSSNSVNQLNNVSDIPIQNSQEIMYDNSNQAGLVNNYGINPMVMNSTPLSSSLEGINYQIQPQFYAESEPAMVEVEQKPPPSLLRLGGAETGTMGPAKYVP